MKRMEPSYRFAADQEGRQLLLAFGRMLEITSAWKTRRADAANLQDIASELEQVEQICMRLPALAAEMVYKKQIENVRFTLEKIQDAVMDREERRGNLIDFQLPCFLLELREEIYFRAYVRPYPKRMAKYYQMEFGRNHANQFAAQGNPRYEVSIFVPAKDKLEYTRQCVESILRETDASKISYELILINHGSRDGTQEYFESIPGAKILHFKENVQMLMFTSAFRVGEGIYAAFVSNDTVVTKNWLTLLLRCIKSHPSIVSATPTTPNVSNFQSTPEQYQTMEEMAQFSAGFNRHDPLKWAWRVRIMPVIALYDVAKLNIIGFADRLFETMEFWDDDFSLRARRAGYRQMLCYDVFCHHFGSITGKQAQIQENSLERGRRMFVEKHHVDPWENGAYYDFAGIHKLQTTIGTDGGSLSILGVDCGFGDTVLQLSNLLHQKGAACSIHGITSQKQYVKDMQAICQKSYTAISEQALLDFLRQGFNGQQYHYIYLSLPLERYTKWKAVLSGLHRRLRPDGVLLLSVSNMLSTANYLWLSSLYFPASQEQICYLNPNAVEAHLAKMFQTVQKEAVSARVSPALLTQLTQRVHRTNIADPEVATTLNTAKYQYLCIGKKRPNIL